MVNFRTVGLSSAAFLLSGGGSGPAGSVRLAAAQSTDDMEPLGVHGSGTTNPSKCFWHIMAKLEEQIKLPSRLTYRAVGSGTGQKEFLGKGIDVNGTSTNTLIPYNNFGAGDIPISREDWIEFGGGGENKGASFVQLPFVLSAVGFFHSIPGVPTGERGLNMTACLLSRIFQADITTWDHPDILAENPGLNVAENYPIFVGRRVKGSSSTYSITYYLYDQCPKTDANPKGWPLDKRKKEIEWPASTYPCDGSGLMSRCLQENEGAIGYVDVAHGHQSLLPEIRVKNGDGFFLTSKEAGDEGIQDAAKDLSKVPSSADGDFSQVAYYNEPGPNTWPIALVSYIYIRKDISFIKNPASRTLLKAFARSLYDPLYIGESDNLSWKQICLSDGNYSIRCNLGRCVDD
ncbi:hypothetical protein ACHAWF_017499 [Thalassiosira exigua]